MSDWRSVFYGMAEAVHPEVLPRLEAFKVQAEALRGLGVSDREAGCLLRSVRDAVYKVYSEIRGGQGDGEEFWEGVMDVLDEEPEGLYGEPLEQALAVKRPFERQVCEPAARGFAHLAADVCVRYGYWNTHPLGDPRNGGPTTGSLPEIDEWEFTREWGSLNLLHAQIPPKTPLESDVERLRQGKWYPIGIPPQQERLDEDFYKTEDWVRLVKTLMEARAAGEDVHIVIANPFLNILRGSGDEPSARQEAADIGFLERLKCEAIQDVLGHRDCRLKRVPTFLMSSFEAAPGFQVLYARVQQLFGDDATFAEAVYSCVPLRFRPRKHHDKSYAELCAMANPRLAGEARSLCSYVLYQVSMVLFLGGEKMGHPGEHSYNAVTLLAARLLGCKEGQEGVQFSDVEIPDAVGVNPYRVSSKYFKGAFVLRKPLEEYLTERDPIIKNLFGELALYEGLLAEHPEGKDWIWVRARGAILSAVTRLFSLYSSAEDELQREVLAFGDLFDVSMRVGIQAISDDALKARLNHAYGWQRLMHSWEAISGPPYHLEAFLLKQSGLFEAARVKSAAGLQAKLGRWLPFNPEVGVLSENDLFKVALLGNGLFYGKSGPFPNLESVHCFGEWKLPYFEFEDALFDDHFTAFEGRSLHGMALNEVGKVLGLHIQIKLSIFGEFLDAIAGTPFEVVYRAWLDALIARQKPLPISAVPDEKMRAGVRAKVEELLESGVFNSAFVAFWRQCLLT